jgi:DNA mismatch repair protein MutS
VQSIIFEIVAKVKEKKETPLMQQYNQFKAQYPGAMLLFRVGDFYETFGEDAIRASKILGIVLTKRANGSASHIELAGFPHHSIETYLPKLVRAGLRVAICEQLEDPKLTKTIVKRGVTEVVTPGVAYNEHILQQKHNNYLAAIYIEKNEAGISLVDISTGEFLTTQGSLTKIENMLQSYQPSELLYLRTQKAQIQQMNSLPNSTFALEDWIFGEEYTLEKLQSHFKVKSLKGFGIDHLKLGIKASGACLHYIHDTHHRDLNHINHISRIEEEKYVWLDPFTIRNLELVSSPHPDGKTLLDVMDYTQTPMGARLLKKWILMPLKVENLIQYRLNIVEGFYHAPESLQTVQHHLNACSDIERLIAKVVLFKANPRDLLILKQSLIKAKQIAESLSQAPEKVLKELGQKIQSLDAVIELIEHQIAEDAPVQLNKGNVFKAGISLDLDELRSIAFGGKEYLMRLQQREAEQTGIPSLKVAFNNVFGYYIEVTNTHKDKVPNSWIRKQTLVNAERYITEELKTYEEKILGAEDKIAVIEAKLYQNVLVNIGEYTAQIQVLAHEIAQIDVFANFAHIAKEHKYVKPEIHAEISLEIKGGRHPVIEKYLAAEESFIPNDLVLNDIDTQIMMITGPNMSGKSAILRQTALMCLMGQIGSFVPASKARIGIVDKIFTRVGASDNMSSGESTFMVEMNETASILNNLSERSLILLDEIGRGTSTYDGISIAWSIAAYLHNHPQCKARTLFATHYHELNEMETSFERIKNYNVAVKEQKDKILFLRILKRGGSEHSFGIHVAALAGMPKEVLDNAEVILKELESQRSKENPKKEKNKGIKAHKMQLNMFSLDDPILIKIRDQVKGLDINTLTPVEALLKLKEIQDLTY